MSRPKSRHTSTAFGDRITRLRRDRGLTQTDLADRLRITQQTVSDYESGRTWPSPQTLIRLAEVLEVTTDELLGVIARKAPPEMSVSQSRLWGRLKKIEGLSRRSQKVVLEVLDALIAKHGGNGEA